MDLFDTYRKMFAGPAGDEIVWWYCGVVLSERAGVGRIPLTQAETLMVYRTTDVDAETFTIDWTEVGYFRDINSGERMEGWFNPFGFAVEPYPRSFVDGPATFTVVRRGAEAVEIGLVQHNARIDGVSLERSVNAASVGLVQTEKKARTFHRPDGSLPALDSPEATEIETRLAIWSPLAAVNDGAAANVASRGFYSSGSGRAGGSGSWAATTVQGTMCKARPDERVNPEAWRRLQQFYPGFFRGDRIAPAWA